jgi:hypothetical protein
MSLRRWFIEHPNSIGESYLEHAEYAASFGAAMLRGALACFLHALIPALFTTTGSRTIARLHDRMVLNRARLHQIAHARHIDVDFLAEHI